MQITLSPEPVSLTQTNKGVFLDFCELKFEGFNKLFLLKQRILGG